MQTLIEKIVNDPEFVASVTVFSQQLMVNAIKEELKRELLARKKISSSPNCSPSASAGTTLDNGSKVRRSSRKQNDWKYQSHFDSSVELHDKHWKQTTFFVAMLPDGLLLEYTDL